MSVTAHRRVLGSALGPRRPVRAQDGFTMIFALVVLLITSLLTAAVFATVNGDASLTRGDLDGKRAYSAAQAAVQTYLYNLNINSTNSQWWETCAHDMSNGNGTQAPVPGSSTGTTYAYTPVLMPGFSTCSAADPVGSLIDPVTGTLRIKFTGYAGTAQKSIVASFKTVSPLSYLWYTVHETVDTVIGGSTCSNFYYATPGPSSSCYIYWFPGDQMNGPLYTQDQLLIGAGTPGPIFGRTAKDTIVSETPTASVCAAVNGCQNAQFKGQAIPNPSQQVPLPTDNSNLLPDATQNGTVLTGTTTLTVSGTTASGSNCPTTSSSCTPVSINLVTSPIIYDASGSGCTSTYTPDNVNYSQVGGTGTYANSFYGPCGDIYISGSYSTPLTIAAGNNVIVTGNLTNSTDSNLTGSSALSGSATLGLVANQYVRVQHDCSGNPNVTIDAAILTLAHSFFVDNYDCGGAYGKLTVHGAIAQYFRGIVGTSGPSGYLKNYNYDNRLGLILPPYLFDLQNTQWQVYRETLCSATAASTLPSSCLYTGA
jgi:hypothetical protein